MKLHPRVSRSAVELVKGFEGFRSSAERTPEGGWAVGYGHTKTAREGALVSPEDAEALLLYDLSEVGRALDALVFAPLNANQFNALAAFGFNIGLEKLRRSSALRRVNEGNYMIAAAAIEQWRKAALDGDSQVVDALVRRRAAEKALFLTPPEGFPRTPTPVLRPEFDPEPLAPEIPAPTGGLELDPQEPASRTLAASESVSARLQQIVYGGGSVEAEPPVLEAPPPAPPPSIAESAPASVVAVPQFAPEPPSRFAELFPHILRPESATPAQVLDAAGDTLALPSGPAEPEVTSAQGLILAEPQTLQEPETTGTPEPHVQSGSAETAAVSDVVQSAWPLDEEAPPPPFELESEASPPADLLPADLAEVSSAETGDGVVEPIVPSEPEQDTSAQRLDPVHPAQAGLATSKAEAVGDARRAAAPLALVGLVMFLGALVAIWRSEPSLLSLLIGLIGVAGMAGGYFLWTGANGREQPSED